MWMCCCSCRTHPGEAFRRPFGSTSWRKSYLIVNQAKDGLPESALKMIESEGLTLIGLIPEDPTIYEYDFEGRPTIDMPDESPSIKAAYQVFDKIIL